MDLASLDSAAAVSVGQLTFLGVEIYFSVMLIATAVELMQATSSDSWIIMDDPISAVDVVAEFVVAAFEFVAAGSELVVAGFSFSVT